ncbi:hypothetical protein LIER_15690 [Lithospermum erythrorhizon]|uniref:Polyprotein n=1 Tax=Lithospermum erythrorhizon TaxID=34254 RepID=A0AAV3Q6A5_LITER
MSKDCYPLANIDRLVDSNVGYKVVNLLDAFREYHHIFMANYDVENTAFIIEKVSRIHDQCEGNRANPEKEAQRLTGRITALTRFISRAGDWSLPFFKAIKRQKSLSGPYEQSFHFPQLLARPVAGDVLQLYLAISESTLSSVLIREEAKVERSVYYISIVLRVGEARAHHIRADSQLLVGHVKGDFTIDETRERQFLVGDLVLRAKQASPHGKPGTMESPRDGPHIIPRIVGPITYGLETLEGRQVSRTWNACHIRKCYL